MKTRKPNPAPSIAPAAPHWATRPWPRCGIALAALVVLFYVYGPAMHTGFLFDDTTQIFALPQASQPLAAWISPIRPVLMFTYWVNTRISLEDTTSYHVFNLLIHTLTGIFVFLVLRRLLELAAVAETARIPFAAFGAALFLLHPLQAESVAYISGRSDSLCGMFACASFAVFLCRRSPAIAWPRVLAVLALFVLAVLSKQQAVVLPALFVLSDLWWNPEFPLRTLRANWRLYISLAFAAAGGLAFSWRLILGQGTGGSAGFSLKDFTWYQYLFTQFRAVFAYLFNFLLPVHLTVDWDFPISQNILQHGAIFGLAGLLALAAAAWHYRRRFPLAGYGYFVFLVLLSPTSSILPIQDPIADRRMYFPILGLILIAIDLLRRLKLEPRFLAATAAAILLAAALATHARAEVWSDPVLLWEDTALKSPNKFRAHFQLAFAYFEQGRHSLAITEFQRSAELKPPTADLLYDWGLCLDALHQPELALAKLQQSAALNPTAQVFTQIAKVLAGAQRWSEALDSLNTAERLDPAFAVTYVFRGKVFLNTNRPAEAVEQYRRALAIDPNVQDGRHDLAIAQSMLRGGR
jgi:tetratricopeptide (TPR) repeat protein